MYGDKPYMTLALIDWSTVEVGDLFVEAWGEDSEVGFYVVTNFPWFNWQDHPGTLEHMAAQIGVILLNGRKVQAMRLSRYRGPVPKYPENLGVWSREKGFFAAERGATSEGDWESEGGSIR